MITLTSIISILVLVGWIIQYKNYKKEICELNPFNNGPTPFTFMLVIGTAYIIGIVIYLILKYLP